MERQHRITLRLLRLAVAVCFLCHGILAVKAATVYYSEWSAWVQSLFPRPAYDQARYFLWTAGGLDLVTAACMLLPRIPRAAFVWAIGWGFATAASRLYFLGAFLPPYSANLLHPVAEVLQRVPNWLLPVALLGCLRGRELGMRWLALGMACVLSALALDYGVDLVSGRYPIHQLKIGEPLWLFHLCGALAVAAVALLALPRTRPVAWRVAALAYLLPEIFTTLWINGPHGFAYTALRLGEHGPQLVSLLLVAAPGLVAALSRPVWVAEGQPA